MHDILIVFVGESFRSGTHGSRIVGNDDSYNDQIEAIQSHCKFIKELKDKKKVSIDIYIRTYETKFSNNMISLYNDSVADYRTYSIIPLEKQTNYRSINDHIQELSKNINFTNYSYLYIIRIDLILKQLFTDLILFKNIYKITFPSICFIPYNLVGGYPRINDVFFIIPKKYFKLVEYNIFDFEHNAWCNIYNKNYDENNKIKNEDLDLLVKTLHDSDPFKDWNPLYKLANRRETEIWHTINTYYDIKKHKFIDIEEMNKEQVEQFNIYKNNDT